MANQKDVGEHLGLTKQYVSNLVSQGILPKGIGRGGMDMDACRKAYIQYLRERARLHLKDVPNDINEEKLRHGIIRALEKRPVSVDQIEASLGRIMHQLRAKGEREISSYEIGELVMLELRELDPVGYVRFASVYRDFQDVSEFAVEIQKFSSDSDS